MHSHRIKDTMLNKVCQRKGRRKQQSRECKPERQRKRERQERERVSNTHSCRINDAMLNKVCEKGTEERGTATHVSDQVHVLDRRPLRLSVSLFLSLMYTCVCQIKFMLQTVRPPRDVVRSYKHIRYQLLRLGLVHGELKCLYDLSRVLKHVIRPIVLKAHNVVPVDGDSAGGSSGLTTAGLRVTKAQAKTLTGQLEEIRTLHVHVCAQLLSALARDDVDEESTEKPNASTSDGKRTINVSEVAPSAISDMGQVIHSCANTNVDNTLRHFNLEYQYVVHLGELIQAPIVLNQLCADPR